MKNLKSSGISMSVARRSQPSRPSYWHWSHLRALPAHQGTRVQQNSADCKSRGSYHLMIHKGGSTCTIHATTDAGTSSNIHAPQTKEQRNVSQQANANRATP